MEITIFTASIALITGVIVALITGLLNFNINERKLKYESAQKDKEFYRDKYEQLTSKFLQIHNTLNEEKNLKITQKDNRSNLADIAQMSAEVEMLIKLYFPNLINFFKDYSRITTHLYTKILYDNSENTITAFEVYSQQAKYLLEKLSDNENIYQYTRKLQFQGA